MSRTSTITVVVIIAVGAILGGAVVGQTQSDSSATRPEVGQAPTNTSVNESINLTAESTTGPDIYVVIATNSSAIDREQLQQYGEVGTQVQNRIEVTISPTERAKIAALPWVVDVQRAHTAQPVQIAGGGNESALGVEQLHERGITGENVRVGVIDTGFRADDPYVSDNIAELRSFTNWGNPDPTHGVQAAQTVVQTAPNAELYLTEVSTENDFLAAIEFLQTQNVDIIVMSLSYPTFDDDGDHILADAIRDAREDGALFVTSAGNQRALHWQGEFVTTDGDQAHEWNVTSGDELQCIPDCTTTFEGQISVILDWEQEGDGSEYALLFVDNSTGEVFDQSTALPTGSDRRVEVLNTRLNRVPLDLAVVNTAGPADDEIEINVYGPATIESPVEQSSITAPADSPAALGVAAYSRADRTTTYYSSVGPTDDGRQAPVVTGYTDIDTSAGVFSGTSAAAPYVAGVAALIEAGTPDDQTPRELESRLKKSADDVEQQGVDNRSGEGVVNAEAAVLTANSTVTIQAEPSQTSVTPGETVTVGYAVENGAVEPFSLLIEFPELPRNMSIVSFDGAVRQNLSGSTPPALITQSVDVGSTVNVSATFAIRDSATIGNEIIRAQVTGAGNIPRTTDNATTTVTIQQEQALNSRFGGDDGEIGNFDVLRAVNAANSGEEIGGKPVSNLDVLRLVNRANA
jgi:hypothetical protein